MSYSYPTPYPTSFYSTNYPTLSPSAAPTIAPTQSRVVLGSILNEKATTGDIAVDMLLATFLLCVAVAGFLYRKYIMKVNCFNIALIQKFYYFPITIVGSFQILE